MKDGVYEVHTKAGGKIKIDVKDGLYKLHGKIGNYLTDRRIKDIESKHRSFTFIRDLKSQPK